MSRFSSDAPMLDKIIDGIAASDTPADLPRALGAAADALRDRPNPLIVIVSDGAFPEAQLGQVTWKPRSRRTSPRSTCRTSTCGISPSASAATTSGSSRSTCAATSRTRRRTRCSSRSRTSARSRRTASSRSTTARTPVDTRTLDLAPGQHVRQIYPKIPGGEDNRLRAALRPLDVAGGSDPFALDDTAYALLARAQEAEGPDGHRRTTCSSRARCSSTTTSTRSRSRRPSTRRSRRSPTAWTSSCSTTTRPIRCRRRRRASSSFTRPDRIRRSRCTPARRSTRTSPRSTKRTP